MFFNIVILKFILLITTPYVFQLGGVLAGCCGDDCKKPIVAKNPSGFFAIKKIVAKNQVGFLQSKKSLQKTHCKKTKVGFLQPKLTRWVFCNASLSSFGPGALRLLRIH